MVPHETVESAILREFGWQGEDDRVVALVGVSDESKGEALVLLTSRDITINQVREKLLAAGLPSLWIPKIVRQVEKIPILGSGKLDVGACQELARRELND